MNAEKTYKLYPRLDPFDYDTEISRVEELLRCGQYMYDTDESTLQWLPLGDKIGIDALKLLRKNIVSLVKSAAVSPGTKNTELTKFDRLLGAHLLEWMQISLSIAADDGMWAYLNIELIPDLIKLRWGYDNYISTCVGRFRLNVETMSSSGAISKDTKTFLFREYIKAISKKLAYILWYALSPDALDALLDECFSTAMKTVLG